MERKRKTKVARKEFLEWISRIGITENIFSNWNNWRTEIPQSILISEKENLNKYLKFEVRKKYNLL